MRNAPHALGRFRPGRKLAAPAVALVDSPELSPAVLSGIVAEDVSVLWSRGRGFHEAALYLHVAGVAQFFEALFPRNHS